MRVAEYQKLITLAKDKSTDVNTPNRTGLYPIHRAVMLRNASWRLDVLTKLFDRGVDVNVRSVKDGYTPLHLAVKQNNIAIVRLLLSQSAICELPDHNGNTPIDLAVGSNFEEIAATFKSYVYERKYGKKSSQYQDRATDCTKKKSCSVKSTSCTIL